PTGQELKTLAHKPKERQAALRDGFRVRFSHDGKTLGSLSQGGVALWDVQSGKLNGLLHETLDFAIHRDGKRLACTASKMYEFHHMSVRFWNLATLEQEFEEGHRSGVHAVALSPDGKVVVTASDDSVRFWDAATGKEQRQLPNVPVQRLIYG